MDSYSKFIESKRLADPASGFDTPLVTTEATKLFPFQCDIVNWACRRGRAALFEECGLGKTSQQLTWADEVVDHTGGMVLILAPLGVTHQTYREGKKFGIKTKIVASQEECKGAGIYITNYEKLHRFNLSKFVAVVLDECFAPDTLVDTITDDGIILKKYIKDIRENENIINASGRDRIVACKRRKINRAVKISVAGNTITASENHPFFTRRGWISAIELTPSDYLVETASAVRLVSNRVCSEIFGNVESEILRSILLSEMANASIINFEMCSQSRGSEETRKIKEQMVSFWKSKSTKRTSAYRCFESYGKSSGSRKSESDIKGHEAQACCARWKWEGSDSATANHAGLFVERLDSRIGHIIREIKNRIPVKLQSGSWTHRKENMHRSGWVFPPFEEITGSEKRCDAGFIRVDSIEILEQGHPELEKWRDADGFVYFYDLEAARHPSFSVNGILVHNSSILKSMDGKTRTTIIENSRQVPHRLACTATPAPNDYMELGNHAEFLGVMSLVEMLATFFVHDGGDTSKWRLKGHAQNEFWKWVCSWAVNIRRPSDLGYDDDGFKLPPLNMKEHIVSTKQKPNGVLFPMAHTLQDRRKARRNSINERVEQACAIAARDEQYVFWCDLNDESEAIADRLGAVEVRGSTSEDERERIILGFLDGSISRVVTKPGIWGFGMNMQCCHNSVHVGISDSFEQIYQTIRRFWRFGQKETVNVHIIVSEMEGTVLQNIKRKEANFQRMSDRMIEHMRSITFATIRGQTRETEEYNPRQEMRLPAFISHK